MSDSNEASVPDGPSITAGAALGCLSVVLGAFGAHALKTHISEEALGWWQTGVQYQMWHALAVLMIGLTGQAWARASARLFTGGAVIFSGTLYAMALGGPHWLGALTPFGGLVMISGWVLLAVRARSILR